MSDTKHEKKQISYYDNEFFSSKNFYTLAKS